MLGREVDAAGAVVKLRNPWAVALLSLIPVYWFVWYFRVNREMRDYGRRRGDAALAKVKPSLAVIAAVLGSFVLGPLYVSAWRTVRRVQRAERACGLRPSAVTVFAVLLSSEFTLAVASVVITDLATVLVVALAGVAVFLVFTGLLQRRLNALWQAYVPMELDRERTIRLRSAVSGV
jgi:hypothetical protein